MSAIDSSLDGITVEFGDEFSESDEERDRSGFGDQSRGGDRSDSKTSCEAVVHSVTSPATVNTRLDCGPNACPTGCAPKKWVLGVRHLSLASDSLNERMAERGKHFSHSTHSIYSSNARDPKRAPKRETVASNKPNVKPMEAIGEEPLQSHESSRRHQNHPTAGNIIYKKNGFNVMKERVEFGRQNDDRQVVTEVNPDSSAPKATKSESKSVPQLNAKYKGRDGLNGDHRSVKLNQNVSVSCKPIPKIDYNTDDNECDYGKRTKNCDKKLKDSNDCDKHKKISDINIHSIGLEAKENKKLSTNFKRSVNSVTLSTEQELQRYKSQRFCETLSLIAIVFGLVLVTITPFLLIPIWVIPNPYSPLIRNFLWLSMVMTILLMTVAALTGNIYWYYDDKRRKWCWFYHCGKGPHDHYWCATLFHNHQPLKPLPPKTRTTHISLNV